MGIILIRSFEIISKDTLNKPSCCCQKPSRFLLPLLLFNVYLQSSNKENKN